MLRGGAGIFYERVQGNNVYNAALNPPFAYQPAPTNVFFSDPHTSVLTGTPSNLVLTSEAEVHCSGCWVVVLQREQAGREQGATLFSSRRSINANSHDSNFGQVTAIYSPRILELGGKCHF